MKRLLVTIGAALLATLLWSGVTKAATFDFVAAASGSEMGGQPLSFLEGGIGIDARGYWTGGSAVAYLDDGGGLGVCHSGLDGAGECTVSSDDNVTGAETLELTFSEAVTLSSISFRDASHGTAFAVPDSLILKVDGAATGLGGLDLASWPAYAGITGTIWEFIYVDEEFYIDTMVLTSAIPLPPAIALFGAALFGLSWLGRRKKQTV
ncbi:MAG: hypothetical protein JKY04_03235 [Sneathiella sp.]|nr:hypothetical protein [Sneathiella sp.]